MDAKNLVPLAGFAFIRLEGVYKDTGLIVIPEKAKLRRALVGRVVAVRMTEEEHRAFGDANLAGLRVVVPGHCRVALPGFPDLFRIPVADILAAISDESLDISAPASRDAPDRCTRCGAAKEGTSNTIMLVDGFCPRCGLNAYGERRELTPRVSDEEVAAFGRLR